MKKAQMEIMGLMLIAIIGGLFLVFALSYSMGSNPGAEERQPHESYGESVIAGSFVSVLKSTDIEQCRTDYETLVRDCANNPPDLLQCDFSGDSKDSCTVIEEVSEQVLEDTLGEWGLDYDFSITRTRDEQILVDVPAVDAQGNQVVCLEREAPGIAIIPLYPLSGEARMRLEICRS